MSDHNEWETGSGLPLADATVTITGMEFGYNSAIAAGAVFANITFTPDEGSDDIEQSFSTGKGFEADRTGKELVSEDGRPRKVNNRSNFGRLIDSAVDCIGKDEVAKVLGAGPRHVDSWIGTRWVTGTTPVETENQQTKEKKVKDAIIFVEYLGRDGQEAAGKPAAASSTGTAAASSNGAPDGVDADLWDRLVTLAGEHDTHEGFVEAALEVDGVESNPAASKAVIGKKAGSVWAAKAKAAA